MPHFFLKLKPFFLGNLQKKGKLKQKAKTMVLVLAMGSVKGIFALSIGGFRKLSEGAIAAPTTNAGFSNRGVPNKSD